MEAAVRAYIDAIGASQRPLFDRIERLIREVAPDVEVVLSYNMPTFRSGGRSLHVAAWKHGVSLYGWDEGRDGGLIARYPELSSGRGTLRLRPSDAEKITDDELRAVIAGALEPPA
jgi:uncharacterized protein YdhG (YjbR/CyaY superfamily)